MQSAWKVGLLVIVFGVLFVIAFNLVGAALLRSPMDEYFAEFADAGGLESGASVTMSGIKVGTVSRTSLASPNIAIVRLEVKPDVFVPADVVAQLPPSLLGLGEQRVELVSERGLAAGRLEPGSTIPGRRPSVVHGVFPEAKEVLDELTLALRAAREVLGDETMRENLNELMVATRDSVAQAEMVMREARAMMAENRAPIREAMGEATLAMRDLREGIQAATQLIGEVDIQEDARGILVTLNEAAIKAEQLMTEMHGFITDPAFRSSLTNTMQNAEAMSATGVDIAANTKEITEHGKIAAARSVEVMDSAKEVADEAKVVMERINEFIGRLPGSVRLPQPGFVLEFGRNIRDSRFQTDMFIRYPVSSHGALFGGVYDLTETNRLTGQYAQSFGPHAIRYGVFASKPGVGVDLFLSPRFELIGDLFDPNDPQLNLRGRFLIGSEMYGWVGLNEVFKRNALMLGLGVRR